MCISRIDRMAERFQRGVERFGRRQIRRHDARKRKQFCPRGGRYDAARVDPDCAASGGQAECIERIVGALFQRRQWHRFKFADEAALDKSSESARGNDGEIVTGNLIGGGDAAWRQIAFDRHPGGVGERRKQGRIESARQSKNADRIRRGTPCTRPPAVSQSQQPPRPTDSGQLKKIAPCIFHSGECGSETKKRQAFYTLQVSCYTAITSGRSAVGSAPRLGRGGRRFKSARPDQYSQTEANGILHFNKSDAV